jgi:hypothetical protein
LSSSKILSHRKNLWQNIFMPHFKLFTSILILALALTARATTIAYDDASAPIYAPGGPYHNLNGGFGFDPWIHSLPAFPAASGGPLHAHIGSSTSNDPPGPPLSNIDTAGAAWGNNADPTGNTFLARRNLSVSNSLPVLGTYSISYDAGDVDGQETISWGLGNNAACQFFFNPFIPNYQFTDVLSATTIVTPIPQTWGGVRLTFTRDTASTYSFEIKRLSDNFIFNLGPYTYDTSIMPAIRTINISNNDGGHGQGHAMFVNAIEATAVPEPSCLFAFIAMGSTFLFRKKH